MKIIAISMNNRRETVNSWHIPNDNIHNAKTIFPKWVPQSPLSQSRPVLPKGDPHFHTVQCAHLAHCKLSICDWSVFKKKHPPQKLQLQWGKKQTNKNWVVLTSCLLSLRFELRSEWRSMSCSPLWKTIFSDRLEIDWNDSLRSAIPFGALAELSVFPTVGAVLIMLLQCSDWRTTVEKFVHFARLCFPTVSFLDTSYSSCILSKTWRHTNVTMRITLLIMQTETWQKMTMFNDF